MSNKGVNVSKIKALISQKRSHVETLPEKQIKDPIDKSRLPLLKNTVVTKEIWEESLKGMLKSNPERSPVRDCKSQFSQLKIKELKDNNRKLRLKITVLENRILYLEAYIKELIVIFNIQIE